MPLMNCPECSTEVSDTAFKCPKCGVALRKPIRSMGGKIVKWSFILFNCFMALWMFGGMQSASEMQAGMEGAEAVGAAIGTGLGAALISGVWFGGFVILGILVLVTRPKAE
jgi:hypothetical protein